VRRRASTLVACAAIAGIGGSVLGVGVSHLVQFDTKFLAQSVAAQNEGTYRQELCFFRAIRADVPRGAGVYLAGNNVVHTQRLAELSTLWATPEVHRSAAEWVVTITNLSRAQRHRYHPATGQFRCDGAVLKVRPI
jgi:hypothetical protein